MAKSIRSKEESREKKEERRERREEKLILWGCELLLVSWFVVVGVLVIVLVLFLGPLRMSSGPRGGFLGPLKARKGLLERRPKTI